VKGTIKRKGEIAVLFDKASKVHTKNILALIMKTEEERDSCGRVAFIAGKKTGSAPVRNKAKRRMREAAALSGAPWPGRDVVFVAKSTVADTEFENIFYDMEQIKRALSDESDQAVR